MAAIRKTAKHNIHREKRLVFVVHTALALAVKTYQIIKLRSNNLSVWHL